MTGTNLVAVRLRFAGGHIYGLVDATDLDRLLEAAGVNPHAGALLVVERLPAVACVDEPQTP